jgi:hypothetical protein
MQTIPQEKIIWPTTEIIRQKNIDEFIGANDPPVMRVFETGATRDLDHNKIDPEACFCPLAFERYSQYMLECSFLPDGGRREDDNWQKGIPITSFMKSLMRHTLHVWKLHRGYKVFDDKTGKPVDLETALCAILFNTFGYLHEILKKKV